MDFKAKPETGWTYDLEAEGRFVNARQPLRSLLGYGILVVVLSIIIAFLYGSWHDADISRLVLSLLAIFVMLVICQVIVSQRQAKRVPICPGCSKLMKVCHTPRSPEHFLWHEVDHHITGRDGLAYVNESRSDDGQPYYCVLRSKWFYCEACKLYFGGNLYDRCDVGSADDFHDQERANCQAKTALKRWRNPET